MTANITNPQRIVLFDGVCNLCTSSVLFILKRDPSEKFRFASLQSAIGQQELISRGLDPDKLHSVILLKGKKTYQKSRAALEIARGMSGLWPLLYAFVIVPPFLRDWLYNIVANNRYRWFGKKDQCMIPSPELKARFLE